jgi:hypothetical protein
MVIQTIGVELFDGAPSTLVQQIAALAQQRFIGYLPGQRVLERILDILVRRLLIDEFGGLQIAQQVIKMVRLDLNDLTHQRKRKFCPDHRKRLKQILLFRRQTIDPRGQDALHRRWKSQVFDGAWELHAPVALQVTVLEQGLEDLLHEQRVALGLLDCDAP